VGRPRIPPPGANDVHVEWAGGRGGWIEIVVLTQNGKPVGAFFPPPGANDIGIAWDSRNALTSAYWTRDGEPVGPIPLPNGANDVHFIIITLPGGIGPTIVKAWWTRNGKKLKQIQVPRGANDFHLL
jgi:hypothetical protein